MPPPAPPTADLEHHPYRTWLARAGFAALFAVVGAAAGLVWLALFVGYLWAVGQGGGSSGGGGSSSERSSRDDWILIGLIVVTVVVIVVGYLVGGIWGVVAGGAALGGLLGAAFGIGLQLTRERKHRRVTR